MVMNNNSVFNDGFTQMLDAKMTDWGLPLIYEMEDNVTDADKTQAEIIEYLKNIQCSMPLGLALRRYICKKEGEKAESGYLFKLSDSKEISVSDYKRENYDVTKDEVNEYTELFLYINEKYNGDLLSCLNKQEVRRLLRVTADCTRDKMFTISFALHMNSEDMNKFLTDILAEQTYNYRSPEEIIAYFCQSNPKYNSYKNYLEFFEEFSRLKDDRQVGKEVENYTTFANVQLKENIKTKDELLKFLLNNLSNFKGYSKTTYEVFSELLQKAYAHTKRQGLTNDDYITAPEAETPQQLKVVEKRINNSIELRDVINTEQLAKEMWSCIPRADLRKKKNGKTVVEKDFINIYNGERGQKSKKTVTTSLPGGITKNLLMRDRLDDLIAKKKAVTRKDLVFLKFYNFSLYLQTKENYSQNDLASFIDECNLMLARCGMSDLYPPNRFENLILLSLYSEIPYEFFENIIEYSFFNEPESFYQNDDVIE